MKLKDFITELQKYDGELDVVAETHQEGCRDGWQGPPIIILHEKEVFIYGYEE